ncbi:hypothetical protein ED328_02215 [Muribaculaceae bacterium Isolate-001 (NCI)]|nr:hypothetical protein ED328_02215 [Muribaculaceae bacterium Isolate-001 (NCI)]
MESIRLKKEGNETVTICNRLKLTAADGKMRLTDVATTEQMFIPHLLSAAGYTSISTLGSHNTNHPGNAMLLQGNRRLHGAAPCPHNRSQQAPVYHPPAAQPSGLSTARRGLRWLRQGRRFLQLAFLQCLLV